MLKLNCFHSNHFTLEDEKRTQYYKEEQKRKKLKRILSHEEWLSSLKIKVDIEKINSENKLRVLQLINKNNQMNLTTRRLNENELDNLLNDKSIESRALRVKDKLGDMGLVGIYLLKIKNKEIKVLDFILSCRAFGRSIEHFMFYNINLTAKKNKLNKVIFPYIKTKKNTNFLDFLKSLKLKKKGFKNFIFNNEFKVKKPNHLN